MRAFSFGDINLAYDKWLADFLISQIHMVFCVLLLYNSSKIFQARIDVMLAQFESVSVNAGVRVELLGCRVGVFETVVTNRLHFLLGFLLINDHLHLVRPEHLNADEHWSALLRLENSCLFRWNVQYALVASRVPDKRHVDSRRQMLIELDQFLLEELFLFSFAGLSHEPETLRYLRQTFDEFGS